jgi:hypothetical protein
MATVSNIPPFAERLEAAYQLIAHASEIVAGIPGHTRDQMAAASHEMGTWEEPQFNILRMLDPNRGWRRRDDGPSARQCAYILAAQMGTRPCRHLRQGGPQPAFVKLPLYRTVCQRCAHQIIRPPKSDDDRCDVCGTHGHTIFTPFLFHVAYMAIGGDACQACADVLGIRFHAGQAS